jgi:hypothetical protein
VPVAPFKVVEKYPEPTPERLPPPEINASVPTDTAKYVRTMALNTPSPVFDGLN